MDFRIKKAERKNTRIRLGLFGPSGSGKTYSALKVAYGLCGNWEKIVVIDTENDSATDYSDLGPFHSINFQAPYSPQRYMEAIRLCENEGYEVIIIDSITHEWKGPGGCLEIQESLGGRYQDWKQVTPMHTAFINAILYAKAHVICCGRAKQDYAMSEGQNGRKEVQKLGMGAQTREGFEYELKISLDINMKHYASVSETGKDRTNLFDGQPPRRLSEEDGKMIAAWCDSGVEDLEEKELEGLKEQVRTLIKNKRISKEKAQKITNLNGLEGQSLDALVTAMEALALYQPVPVDGKGENGYDLGK